MKNYKTLSTERLESKLSTCNMTLSEMRGSEIEMAPVWESRKKSIEKVLSKRNDISLYR
jgi:hypothetical protein